MMMDQSILNDILNIDYYGLMVVDRAHNILFVNGAFAELFNIYPKDVLNKDYRHILEDSQLLKLGLVMEKGQPEIGEVHIVNGRTMVVNQFPIYSQGRLKGAFAQVIFGDFQKFNHKPVTLNIKANVTHAASDTKYNINDIKGCSAQIVSLKETIYKTANRNSTVLIRGESGTGKELFAHAIHNLSPRKNQPFIKINCTAIPEHLLESELFGYVEGAFTGASKGGKKGKFELANSGTILLDEIGDMSLNMQAKILRVLQEKEFEPLGSHKTKAVDVRILAATNVNLEELIEEKKFREDLYYRLNVVTLNIPALRDRVEDLEPLVEYFLDKFNKTFNLQVQKLSPRVMEVFKGYKWPGNIRELENVLEQAFNFVEGNIITLDYIPDYIISRPPVTMETTPTNTDPKRLIKTSDEKAKLLQVLKDTGGNKAKAAKLLGISRTALYKKLARFQIYS